MRTRHIFSFFVFAALAALPDVPGDAAPQTLVSEVVLGEPVLNRDDCNHPLGEVLGSGIGTDTKTWPATGAYVCPNGNRGFIGADSSQLVATGTLGCVAYVRTCEPVFGNPMHEVDGTGALARVAVQNRQLTVTAGCENVGDVVRFGPVRTTTNVYDTSPVCTGGGGEDPCAGGCAIPTDICPEGTEVVRDGCGCEMCYSPIFIQLDGRAEFSSPADGVDFDMFGNGRRMRLSWPVSRGTAWLALDRNGNGAIDNGTELFGNSRRLATGVFARNGYEVLAELDDDGNGLIDVTDPAYRKLLLWEDRDRDGRSSLIELMRLADVGIRSLSLNVMESRQTDRWGNRFTYRAKVDNESPPHEQFSYDVFLSSKSPTASACNVSSCAPRAGKAVTH